MSGGNGAGPGDDFDAWRERVDAWVWRIVGLSIDDLADVALKDWFDDGVNAKAAALLAICCEAGAEVEEVRP
jgi:hypothetical protein